MFPRQFGRERSEQVEQNMGYNDVIVQSNQPGHNDHSIPDTCQRQSERVKKKYWTQQSCYITEEKHQYLFTFKQRVNPPDRDWSQTCVLSEGHLHIKEGQSHQCQHNGVRNEKSTCKQCQNLYKSLSFKIQWTTVIISKGNPIAYQCLTTLLKIEIEKKFISKYLLHFCSKDKEIAIRFPSQLHNQYRLGEILISRPIERGHLLHFRNSRYFSGWRHLLPQFLSVKKKNINNLGLKSPCHYIKNNQRVLHVHTLKTYKHTLYLNNLISMTFY